MPNLHQLGQKRMMIKKAAPFILVILCVSAILLALPTISRNIDNPSLITYFSSDEGYLMDLVWRYFSGERRGSYQNDLDYGLELVYVADAARFLFSKWVHFTPGIFVAILRWLHLLSWVGALIALWRLVGYHFGRPWQQIAAVLLLWSRPAFNYFLIGLKPDPLVLLLIIIGLDYTLRIAEKPSRKYLLIAVACASAAIVVKFAGIFLLPAIVAALYFGNNRQAISADPDRESRPFMRVAWLFPSLSAAPLIAAPFLAIFFYVRKATGLTYYQEFGLLKSVMAYKIVFLLWFAGILLMMVSASIFLLNRSARPSVAKTMKIINELNSYGMTVSLLCAGFVLLFGFRWFTIPRHLLEIYAVTGVDFAGGEVVKSIHTVSEYLSVFMKNIADKSLSFGIAALFLAVISVLIDAYSTWAGAIADKVAYYKRATLVIFLAPLTLAFLSIGRFVQLHMLPFFVAASILAIQAGPLSMEAFSKRKILKNLALFLVPAALIIEISTQGVLMIKERMREFRQHEDIAYTIDAWWKENMPPHAKIVSDHYIRVYIPPITDNIKVLSFSAANIKQGLRDLADSYSPRFVYYNERVEKKGISITDIVPDKKVRLIKVFDDSQCGYQRYPGARFMIYEILH